MNGSFSQQRSLLTTYLRPLWASALLTALLLLGSIALDLLSPQILRSFIDTAEHGGPQSTLTQAALMFLAVALFGQLIRIAATMMSERVGWRATNLLRSDLLRHTLNLDLSFHRHNPPGALIQRVDGDVNALANFFAQLVSVVLGNGLLIVGVLTLLWREDWRVGVGIAIYAIVTLSLLGALQRFGAPRWEAAQQAEADLGGFVEERLRGTEDIRANGAGSYVLRRLDNLNHALLVVRRRALLAGALTHLSTQLLFAIGFATGLGLGAWLYIRGDASIGTAFLITTYVSMLASPLEAIRSQLEDLQQAAGGISRISALLAVQPSFHETPRAHLPAGPLPVAFEDVTFSYRDEAQASSNVLDQVSFELKAGQVLGVLGRTGSGKTTLTRMLFRLYDPNAGNVQIGGVDVRDLALAELRGRVGMVTQDVQIFDASVRDNLTLFRSGIEDTTIWGVLDTLGLRSLFAQLPNGLDTQLGTGGVGLSAGQAQLLACARVFLRDPGLVILDEASSRLDPATEALLEQAIDQLLVGRTAIIIAHRLQTVRRANQIIILDAGTIIENGPRSALAADPQSRFSALLRTGMEEVLA